MPYPIGIATNEAKFPNGDGGSLSMNPEVRLRRTGVVDKRVAPRGGRALPPKARSYGVCVVVPAVGGDNGIVKRSFMIGTALGCAAQGTGSTPSIACSVFT